RYVKCCANSWFVAVVAWVAIVGQAGLLSAGPKPPRQTTELEDPVTPLRPNSDRTERDLDRLHAAALFATARLQQQRGELEGALRNYQRAYRYDPAQAMLEEIVP